MATKAVQSYCLSETRCGLCRFNLKDGETVVAVIGDNGQISTEFPFRREHTFRDDEEGFSFHMCRRDSWHLGQLKDLALCCHTGCYAVKLFPPTPKFIKATKHTFDQSASGERQRGHRIQRTLASRLKRRFLDQLPLEICTLVAGYLVRECATVASQQLVQDTCTTNSLVDLSQDVYAQYVRVEGVLYLRSLYNALSSDDRAGTARVFKARNESTVRVVYIRYDHFGVRDISFVLPPDDSKISRAVRGVWWAELTVPDEISQLGTISDGLKAREVRDSGGLATRLAHDLTAGWPTLGLDRKFIDLQTCEPAGGFMLRTEQMTWLDLNQPGLEAYSAAINGFHVSTLYAHGRDTQIPPFEDLESVFDDILWLYMPIDRGEYLTEIWCAHATESFIAFLFVTSTGRKVRLGPYFEHPGLYVQLIYTTTNAPSRVYFNEWRLTLTKSGIQYFGADSSAECDVVRQRHYPPLLVPALPPPFTQPDQPWQYNTPPPHPWFYTSCRMENVVKITCCVKKSAASNPIIGMLLHYENDHRECLGQYRADLAAAPVWVNPGVSLKIGIAGTVERSLYVAAVGSQSFGDSGSQPLHWIEVPWRGTLEWWFSLEQCELRHSELDNQHHGARWPQNGPPMWV